MRTYTLDPNLSTEDAMLVIAAKLARNAGQIAAKMLALYITGGATRSQVRDARGSRDALENSELVLAGLAGYVDGYPEHIIAAIEAD